MSKEFAHAVINKLKEEELDLYQTESNIDKKIVKAYDAVLAEYVKDDKLDQLPQFFKEDEKVK